MKTFLALFALLTAPFVATASAVTLADYWPHEDGRQWIYDQHHEELGGAWDDLQGRMWFDGTTTAPIGIAAQMLKSEIASPPAPVLARAGVPIEIRDPFLRHLWLARPDLRTKIAHASAEQPCESSRPPQWAPILLGGGLAYVQTASEIAAWRCDVPNTKAWLWLTSDLTPGTTTTLQLVPDLASDVFLHVTVGPTELVTVPAGSFANSLRVDYSIDYGVSECTDTGGDPVGTFAALTEGYVHYAPGVGPVDSFEEFSVDNLTGSCPGPEGVLAWTTLKLHEPSVPALSATWGGIKAAYHH